MDQKQRYEREIEELLDRLDSFIPSQPPPPPQPPFTARLGSFLGELIRSIDSGKLALAGVVLILLGALARFSLGPLAQFIIALGAVMLVGAYVLYFTSSRTTRYRKRWRGREIEFDREPTVLERWVDNVLQRLRGRQ